MIYPRHEYDEQMPVEQVWAQYAEHIRLSEDTVARYRSRLKDARLRIKELEEEKNEQ